MYFQQNQVTKSILLALLLTAAVHTQATIIKSPKLEDHRVLRDSFTSVFLGGPVFDLTGDQSYSLEYTSDPNKPWLAINSLIQSPPLDPLSDPEYLKDCG